MAEFSRVTCFTHQKVGPRIAEKMRSGPGTCVIRESARSVRQMVRRMPFGILGNFSRLVDTPVDIYRCTVPSSSADTVVEELIRAGELQLPGHGTVFHQRVEEFLLPEQTGPETGRAQSDLLVTGLSLITAILSVPGTEERIARTALELGTCVPVIANGAGTGIRDRLGLLRITIPPEKHLAHLIVPTRDAFTIMRLLIEEARLDSPGKGIIYSTPVSAGLMDTRLRLGRQEHAASIEQIIAAIDQLKSTTAWRARFAASYTEESKSLLQPTGSFREVCIVCRENEARSFVDRAVDLGAGGATTARVQRLDSTVDGAAVETAARERVIINTSNEQARRIVDAIHASVIEKRAVADSIQITDIPTMYSYR